MNNSHTNLYKKGVRSAGRLYKGAERCRNIIINLRTFIKAGEEKCQNINISHANLYQKVKKMPNINNSLTNLYKKVKKDAKD